MISDFPATAEAATSFLTSQGITHVLSIAPSAVGKPEGLAGNITYKSGEITDLLEACVFIREALEYSAQARIIIHSVMVSRACEVAAAYRTFFRENCMTQIFGDVLAVAVMYSQSVKPSQALEMLEDGEPQQDAC